MDRDVKYEKSVGNRVKYFRDTLGWSQGYLADIAGVTKKQVQRIEGGVNSPYLKTVVGLAKALGRQPGEIFQTDYKVKVNTNLGPQLKHRSKTTSHFGTLLESNFLNNPKSVKEIIQECSNRYKVTLKSSALSGVLKIYVDQKILKRTASTIKGRFLYQKVKQS